MNNDQSLSETPTSGVTQSTLIKPHQSSKPIILVFLLVIMILSLAGNIYQFYQYRQLQQASDKLKIVDNNADSTSKRATQEKLVKISYNPPYPFSWSLEGGSTLSLAEVSLGDIPSPGIGLRKPFSQEFSKPGEEVRALVLRFKLVGGTRESTCIPTNWILVVTKDGGAIPPSNTGFNCVGNYQTIFDNIYFVVPPSTNYFILRKEPGATSEDSFEITLSDGSLRVDER